MMTRALALLALLLLPATSRPAAQTPQVVLNQDARLAQLAAEAASRGPATPIPLTFDGGRALGAVYDRYLIGVVIGRAQLAAGGSADPARISAHEAWVSRGTVVVAYPINCDGRPNRPVAIRWQTSSQGPVAPSTIAGPMRGAEAQSLLPGVGLPDDALVINLRNAIPTGASVAIDYAGPVCRGAATTAVLPYAVVPSLELARAFAGIKLPNEFASLPSPTTVRLRVTTDATGRARFPEQVQGPPELGPAAIAAVTSRTFAPATVNGVPTPLTMVVPFVFTSTGAPAPAAPYMPTLPPGAIVTSSLNRVTVPAPTTSSQAPVAPAPPGQVDLQLARLAAEVAQKGDPTPVPMDAAGPARHGVIFDRFLVGAVKARAAFRFGTPIDPASAPASLVTDDLVAVAFPLECSGRTVTPIDLQISMGGASPGPLSPTGEVIAGGALAARLPGVDLPAGAAGRTFANGSFSQNLEVGVTYSGPVCSGDARTLTLPIQWVRGQGMPRPPAAKLPAGVSLPSPTQVRLRGVVDLDGAYRFPTLADGPAELAVMAVTAASQWRYQPYRANGVPSPQVLITSLTFTASGMPEPGPVGPPPTGAPPAAGGPPIMTSTTIGGRLPGTSTPDEPGLSRATSKCETADDASYGLTPAGAVKVGGGATQGPARARQYLSALRGPSGQGLSIVRRGATMAPGGGGILDLYELRYAGLVAPIQVYVDQYAEAPLKAPQGLVCAAALK